MSTCTDDQTYRKNIYPPIFIYNILHQIRVQSSPKISLNCHQINPFDHKKKQRDSDDNIIPCDKSILYTFNLHCDFITAPNNISKIHFHRTMDTF